MRARWRVAAAPASPLLETRTHAHPPDAVRGAQHAAHLQPARRRGGCGAPICDDREGGGGRRGHRAQRAKPAPHGLQACAGVGGRHGCARTRRVAGTHHLPHRRRALADARRMASPPALHPPTLPFPCCCCCAVTVPSGFGLTRTVRIPQGHVWLQGDNFSNSTDSRHYGPVPYALLRGHVCLKASAGPRARMCVCVRVRGLALQRWGGRGGELSPRWHSAPPPPAGVAAVGGGPGGKRATQLVPTAAAAAAESEAGRAAKARVAVTRRDGGGV